MALNKRIRRVLLENRSQYIGSMALIIFSCFTFTLMTLFAVNFERMANAFQADYAQEDANFSTDEPIDNLPALEAAANAVIEETRTFDYPLAEGQTLRIFSRNDQINLAAIVDGSDLNASGEILLNPVFAASQGYQIGDQIDVLGQPFTIVGFMALPNYIFPLQSDDMMMPAPGFGTAVVSKADFAALGQGGSYYAVKFNEAGQSALEQSVQFKDLLGSRGIEITQWTGIDDNRRVNIVDAEVTILGIISKGMPTAILLLTTIMVGNVIWRMIDRESTVIGALYALGYKRREIYRHYLMFPLVIAVVGGVIGTILGLFPVRSMVTFMFTAFIIPVTEIGYDPVSLIVSILLPVVFLGVSSYFVIRKELRHSPVELMRGKEETGKVNFLERAVKLDRLSFSARFQIREQLRSLSRLAFLLTGVAVAAMLLLWGFALKSGFDYMLTNGLSSVYHFVYEYKFDNLRFEPLPEGAEPGASALFVPEGDDTRDFYVTGIAPDSEMLTLEDATGARLTTDQTIITRSLADQVGVNEGGVANLVRKSDGRAFAVAIDRIAETYAGNFIFMPLNEYNATFELPAGSYNGAFSNVRLDIPEDESYSMVSLEDKVAAVQEAIAPTESLTTGLAIVASIIGLIVIYVVTTLIVEENKSIISLMKIFGYRRKEINALILNSSTFIVVLGYLIGIPLVLAALGVLTKSLQDSIGLSLPPMRIDLPYLIFGFVMIMACYELSKLLCRKKVNAVPMNEALKAGME